MAGTIALAGVVVASGAAAAPLGTPVPTTPTTGARPGPGARFWSVAVPSGGRLTLEQYDAPGPGAHPTVVLLPGSAGKGTADEARASEFARQGFTGVSVCWFRVTPLPPTGVDCPGAPSFHGVTDRAAADVATAIAAVKRLPGVDPDRVGIWGFSRGGGIAALVSTRGGPEPVVAVSGLFDPASFAGALPSEVNVIARAGGITAPTLLQYGRDDGFVPWPRNAAALAAALGRAGRAPAAIVTGYPGGHGIGAPAVLADEYAFFRRTLTPARTVAARTQGGFYVLDADGTVTARGGAPFFGAPARPGRTDARDLAVMPDGRGYVVLDGDGELHRYGSATRIPGRGAPRFPADLARAVAVNPSGTGLVVLDAWGALHPVGSVPALRTDAYWRGWDIARDVVFTPDGAGALVLDGFGGVHKLGTATRLVGTTPYRRADVATAVVMAPDGDGYAVLDRSGLLARTGSFPAPSDRSAAAPATWVGAAWTDQGWVALRRDRAVALWH